MATAEEAEAISSSIDAKIAQLILDMEAGRIDGDRARTLMRDLVMKSSAAAIFFANRAAAMPVPRRDTPPPSWCVIPPDVTVPTGRPVVYLRLRSDLTDMPDKGFPIAGLPGLWRTSVMWPLTDSEETTANKRAAGEQHGAVREQTKQMIRVIDGKKADWSGRMSDPAAVDTFWNQIGSRYRGMFFKIYAQWTALSPAEQVDFFENCVEVRIGG